MSRTVPQRPDGGDDGTDRTQPTHVRRQPLIEGIELEDEVGRGGMGVVYRGTQAFLQRQVAVKLITSQAADVMSARFQREARILSSITHPNIVGCYQAGVLASGEGYIVMEFVDGPTLRQMINKSGALRVGVALRVCRDVACALESAHASDVIHRDVKPENIMLQRSKGDAAGSDFPFVPKLVDFGIARSETGTDGLTNPGEVIGTCSTMAPEQFDATQTIDHRADIYALGCVLFHSLTGRAAFPEKSVAAVVASKQFGKVPDPRDVVAELPDSVVRLVRSMLQKDRDDRPATYVALLAQFDAVIESSRGDARPKPGWSRRPTTALVLVGLAVIAVWGTARACTAPIPKTNPAVEDPKKTDPDKPDPEPPPVVVPEPPPEVKIQVQDKALVGSTVEFRSTVSPGRQKPVYAWSVVAGFAPSGLVLDGPSLQVPLADAVPGVDLAVELRVTAGANAAVVQSASVGILPSSKSVMLLPDEESPTITGWDLGDRPACFRWYGVDGVVSADARKGAEIAMARKWPSDAWHLTGAIELSGDVNKAPTGVTGLRFSAGTASSLSLELALVSDGKGSVAVVTQRAAGASSAPTELKRLAGIADSRLYFSLRGAAGSMRLVFGDHVQWDKVEWPNPVPEVALAAFARDGIGLFYDFRLETN